MALLRFSIKPLPVYRHTRSYPITTTLEREKRTDNSEIPQAHAARNLPARGWLTREPRTSKGFVLSCDSCGSQGALGHGVLYRLHVYPVREAESLLAPVNVTFLETLSVKSHGVTPEWVDPNPMTSVFIGRRRWGHKQGEDHVITIGGDHS